MAVKLADTLAPMGDFAVAESKDIDVVIGDKTKRLQKAIEDGDIGGGGGSSLIDDEVIAEDSTWSSSKIDEFGQRLDKKIDDSVGDLTTLKTTDKTSAVGAINEINDSLVDKVPFKFGITEDGKYGYIKDGADSVTPFSSILNLKILNYVTHADGTYNDTFEVEKDGRYIVIGNVNADGRANSTLTISVDGKTPLETKREDNQIAYQDNVRRTNNIHQCSIYDLQQGDVIKCNVYAYGYGKASFTVIGIE